METRKLNLLKQIATGVAAQFGSKCEVVIHEINSSRPYHSIVFIENGHVSGRKVGDGASQVVLDQLADQARQPKDHLCYLTRTPAGRILKSSSLYIRNRSGVVTGVFSINYDVTDLILLQKQINEMVEPGDKEEKEPEKLININDVLNELIDQSVEMIGKPVALMNKDEKIRAINFLNKSGAFLVTKSSDKVAQYFGISKYTLYSYLDSNKQQEEKK